MRRRDALRRMCRADSDRNSYLTTLCTRDRGGGLPEEAQGDSTKHALAERRADNSLRPHCLTASSSLTAAVHVDVGIIVSSLPALF